ncbi:hypothetical protein CASFOL_036658 [Castilleja foliolosa]|uniref:Hepatoma-derived growth factor-related protein 2-like n=1 Tax=Castilleja foliolosa TaxID=1961234 RepID=A0ABD3BNM8_9LAMI
MDDFFSDSDGEKAVEELLSQAMDSTVLDQVAAINCAGFTDSGLPSHLEARFHRLKSFPSSAPKPAPLSTKSFNLSHPKISDPGEEELGGKKKLPTTCSTKCPEEKSYLSDNNNCSPFSPFKENPHRKMNKRGSRRRKSPSSSSFSDDDGFSSRSISPPVKTGCFLCSPKKVYKKKNKENRGLDLGLDWGKNDDKLLSDLSNFSVSSQRRMKKKAMEEEEKICKEAEKIVKWAKQASARMDISGIEDELSDDENAKFH